MKNSINSENLLFDKSEYEIIMDCLSIIYSGYKLNPGWEGSEYISFNEFLRANFVDEEIKKIIDIIIKIENYLEKNNNFLHKEEKNKKIEKVFSSPKDNIIYFNFNKNSIIMDDDKT